MNATLSKTKIERSLFVETREWHDKTYGNTYFSARIWVDGHIVGTLGFQYGYGDQSLYEAQKWLLANDYLPQEDKNGALSYVTRNLGIDFYHAKTNVTKREMFKA